MRVAAIIAAFDAAITLTERLGGMIAKAKADRELSPEDEVSADEQLERLEKVASIRARVGLPPSPPPAPPGP